MKRILVTGGTVFVSRFVAEYYIAKGYEVYVLNRNSKEQPARAKLIEADRHNLGEILRPFHFDVVIDTGYTAEDVDLLLDALGSFEDYFLISSSAVYPENAVLPFTEETLVGPNAFWGKYGTNKIEAEHALLKRNPNAYILRPPYLYGQMNNVYREAFVFECAQKDRPFYLPKEGKMKLQFFHVRDLCRFIDVILQKRPEQHIYNVGNKEAVSIREWVELCYRVVGKNVEFVNVLDDLDQRNYFSFYNYEYCLDVSKQCELMPDTISLYDGLVDAFDWYRKHSDQVKRKPYIEYIDNNLRMKIIEYFTADNQKHWLSEIKKCDWGAGQYLHQLLQENNLKNAVGANALVPMLVEGDALIAFCTFAPLDDIQPTDLSPWIGFVYTFPQYRGHRYAGLLLDYAESIATVMGKEYIYISTGHTGLHEKYGYEFYKMEKDIEGEDSRVYRKALAVDGPKKDERLSNGAKWKAEIVEKSRQGVDMTAYCGFSCNHCFLGEWCGGCRSAFNCCSYGTLHEKGKCPNADCCQNKGIDGCYACSELETCTKGFYQPENDGAGACKAQAMFIKKYGKEEFSRVHDKLHESYDFKKTQEILGNDAKKGLQILEGYL